VQAGSDVDADLAELIADRGSSLDGSGRAIEDREETVARRVQLAAVIARQLTPYDRVVAADEVPPAASPSLPASSVDPTMSVNRTVARTRSGVTRLVTFATKRAVAAMVARWTSSSTHV
jgi:hypothetical protein